MPSAILIAIDLHKVQSEAWSQIQWAFPSAGEQSGLKDAPPSEDQPVLSQEAETQTQNAMQGTWNMFAN